MDLAYKVIMEDEDILTERSKEYFEWLENNKNYQRDRYDIFMNRMNKEGFKTYDINNRSGVRVINPINRKMVDYYHRRKKVCFYINGRQKWNYDLSFQSIIRFLSGS